MTHKTLDKIKSKLSPKSILKILLILFLACVLSCGAFAVYCIASAPDIGDMNVSPDGYRTTILDRDGNVLLTLSGQESNRVYVKYDDIPKDLVNAFVAIEDTRFFTHNGIDIRGILRAIFRGITRRGFSEGASTITQQLIKNNVLTGWTEEQTFADKLVRKIQEQYLAVRLEKSVSKEWILENYLNTINLGGGNWGVETASMYYFGKDVSTLNLSECAVIAGITKNPTGYNPVTNPVNNANRRKLVLKCMLNDGYIDDTQYNEALRDDVYARIANTGATHSSSVIMNYFEDALVTTLLRDLQVAYGMTEEAAWNMLYRGGLTVYSTEDPTLQQKCEKITSDSELIPNDSQTSCVLLDNATGQVLALIGGSGPKQASLIYNRALSSVRQPGSTFKIIGEYAAGLEDNAFTLGTVYDDAPYTYSDGTPISNSDGSYSGKMTVRDAIIDSNNVVALKCLQDVTLDRVWESLRSFGISTLEEDKDKYEALALGGTGNGVTNLELTSAYSVIARGGEYKEPVFYTKILDMDGNKLIQNTPESHAVISKDTARLLALAMQDVVEKGTASETAIENYVLAGKTGTTSGSKDSWMVGFSDSCTLGVWGGKDDNSPLSDMTYVKNIWKEIMAESSSPKSEDGSSEESLATAKICTKCGKLAVTGLCNASIQRDMTRDEFFREGTVPTKPCDCHEAITICSESGKVAGPYCPITEKITNVYLKEGTPGTADAEYCFPNDPDEKCSIHQSVLDIIFGSSSDANSEDSTAQNQAGPGENEQNQAGSQENEQSPAGSQGNEQNQAGSQENEQSPAGSQENEQSDSGGIEDTFRNWWNDLFS